MHGDTREPQSIVLTRSHFIGYDATSRPMGAMVQSLMITRHLLVVGASMTDDNFLRLVREVIISQKAGAKKAPRVDEPDPIGTVVTLVKEAAKARLWNNQLHYVAVSDHEKRIPDLARDLAIFLDLVAMLTSTSAHLLDARYEHLLESPAQRSAAVLARELFTVIDKLPSVRSAPWLSLRVALAELGEKPQPDDV